MKHINEILPVVIKQIEDRNMSSFVELPRNKKSLSSRKTTFGIGINDANYMTQHRVNGIIKRCPYFSKWVGILERCYDKKRQAKAPTYIGCTVAPEWLYFSNFRKWMETKDWIGKEIDKDILYPGNKIYSPDNCVFVDKSINALLTSRAAMRGEYPQGVHWHKASSSFVSDININGKKKHLGCFNTVAEAQKAYITEKIRVIRAVQSNNPEISEGLERHIKIMENIL